MAFYRQLNAERREIRLLRLVDVPPDDRLIELQLESFPLADAPSYDALSYVWGEQTPKHPITVNGSHFEIGGSLLFALGQLSRATRAQPWFWIDAICIDQSNTDEKSSQVQLMRAIFQTANCVWISLRDSSEALDPVLDVIKSIGPKALEAGVLDLWDNLGRVLSGSIKGEHHQGLAFLVKVLHYDVLRTQTSLDAITDLLSRPNWSRAWILQEIALAARGNILCGENVIDVAEFHAAITAVYLTKVGSFPRQDLAWRNFGHLLNNNLFDIHSLIARRKLSRGDTVELFDLLVNHGAADESRPWHEASDPRDIIYALLGVASDARVLGISPNYRKSVAEVYTEATRAMMAHNTRYRLEYCSFPKDISGLPSWVPDWQRAARMGLFPHCLSYGTNFKASGDKKQPAMISTSPEWFSLSLRGVLVDSIVDVFSMGSGASQQSVQAPGGMMLAEALRSKSSRGSCIESILRFTEPILSTKTVSEADVWRLMLAGHIGTADRPSEFDAIASRAFRQQPIHADTISGDQIVYMLENSYPFPQKLSNVKDIQEFVDVFSGHIVEMAGAVARMRTLFLTQSGRLGLGPFHVQKGDSVTVLFGTQVPIILREKGSRYNYVGESYVVGIMQGEAVDGVEDGMEFVIE